VIALIEDAIVRSLDAKDALERELPLLQYQASYDGKPVWKKSIDKQMFA